MPDIQRTSFHAKMLSAIVVFSTILSACGSSAASSTSSTAAKTSQAAPSAAQPAAVGAKKTIVWLLPTDPLLDPWATKTAIPMFEKAHPDVTIQVVTTPHVGQKLLAMEAAGTPPDIFTDWGTAQFRALYNNHQLLNLSPVIKAHKLDLSSVLPAVLSHYVAHGNTYGIPWLANPITIGYNATLFKQYHVPLPPASWSDTSWTTDQLRKDAMQLTHNRKTVPQTIWGIQYANIRDLPWLWGADLYNTTGGPLDSSAYTTGTITILNLTDPNVIDAIQWYIDLIYTYRVNPPPADMAALSTLGAPISSGRVAMEVIPANGMVRNAMADKFKFQWGIAPIPYGPGKSDQTSINENAWMVSAQTKHPTTATEFVVFLATLPGKDSPAAFGFLGPTKSSFDTWAKVARSLPNFDMPKGALTAVVWDEMHKPLIYNPADAFDNIAEMNTAWTQLMAPVYEHKEGVLTGLRKVQAKYAQIAGCGACAPGQPAARTTVATPRQTFAYGFDLSTQEPDQPSLKGFPNYPGAVASARAVMANLPRSYVDQAIFGFGAISDPEPSPGVFNMGDISRRIAMIQAARDTPVITLVSAPKWMKGPVSTGKSLFASPPAPDHYQDFAALAAHVALRFPQVKYFVVWSELRGFWDPATRSWDYRDYTRMYNDVYRAIKRVRPDALVGGPYANMTAYPQPVRGVVSTVHGRWGYLDQGMLDAVSYWLAHKAGADFIAVDGATAVAKTGDAGLADPVTAAGQYAAVDRWIRSRSDLPIWWMESHIQPLSGWTPAQGVAARIATLAEMAGSGASVGMQWQPQEQVGWPDEGLWTSTLVPGGGQPTPLATLLPKVLPILDHSPVLMSGEPTGVLVAVDNAGILAVNTTAHKVTAEIRGSPLALLPAQVYTSRRR